MFSKIQPSLWLLTTCLLLGPSTSSLQATPELMATFAHDAPIAWGEQRAQLGRWQGSYRETRVTGAGPTARVQVRDASYFFSADVGGTKLVIHNPSAPGAEISSVSNLDYGFEARHDEPEKKNYLFSYNEHPRTFNDQIAIQLRLIDTVNTDSLTAYLKGEVGTVQDVQQTTYDGKPALKVLLTQKTVNNTGILPGFAIVDPAASWAVRYWQVATAWGTVTQVNTYRMDLQNLMFPIRNVHTLLDKKGTVGEVETVDYSKPAPCALAANDFQIEQYGLSRPRVARAGGVILAANLIGLLIAAIAFYWFKTKSSLAKAEESRQRA